VARYCLDASFVVRSLSLISPAVVQRWFSFTSDDELIAPSLLRAECTSALARLVHTGRINEADARRQVAGMLSLSIRIVERDPLYPRALEIARSLGQSKAYDALYLAAAGYEAAELLTVDRGMRDAAKRLGIRATLVR
jgi:predicted nucleic acid-binding protein